MTHVLVATFVRIAYSASDVARFASLAHDAAFPGPGDPVYLGLQPVFLGASPAAQAAGEPAARVSIELDATELGFRVAILSADPGPAPVDVWTATPMVRPDVGAPPWRVLRHVGGRLSASGVSGGIWRAEVETWSGDLDRQPRLDWSDAAQRRRHPGDRGFEYLAALATMHRRLRWPP